MQQSKPLQFAESMQFDSEHLGIGVFETFLVRKTPGGISSVVGWKYHLERLQQGCSAIGLDPPSEGKIVDALANALVGPLDSPVRVRVMASPAGMTVAVKAYEAVDSSKGISLFPVWIERALPGIKSFSALPSVIANKQARQNGFEEALLVDNRGVVTEAAWANFIWFDRAGKLHAPIKNALPGVTRQVILDNWVNPVDFSEYTLQEIAENATEACITQATAGVVPVARIGAVSLKLGPLVHGLKESYQSVVKSLQD